MAPAIWPSTTQGDMSAFPSCCCCSQQSTFDLDPTALEKRYKLLQWQLHPDKSVSKTRQEQEYSAEQASLINQAYGVLRSPLSRANYMVSSGNDVPVMPDSSDYQLFSRNRRHRLAVLNGSAESS